MAKDVAYDFMIQAMGGLLSVTGVPDDETGAGPQKVGVPIRRHHDRHVRHSAILAAVARRSESGKGDTIDISMLNVATATLANQVMNYLVSGDVPTRRSNKHSNIQPQDIFPVCDGHIVIAVGNDEQFGRFADALGMPELAEHPRYVTNKARAENLDTPHLLLCARLMERDLAHWRQVLTERHVPCAPINMVQQVLAEPQIRHREMLRALPHPWSGTVPSVVSPMRFADAPFNFELAPPLLGEHTREILARLQTKGVTD